MKDGTYAEPKPCHCCGTCYWYNGEIGDGVQFCDDKEIEVKDTSPACYRWIEKWQD